MEDFFGRICFGGSFWEEFLAPNFLGEFVLEDLFWRIFFGKIFWEDFLGGFFCEDFFERNSLLVLLKLANLFESERN